MNEPQWEDPGISAGDALSQLIKRLDPSGQGQARARAVAAWRDVAGDEVWSHARGFALRGGELLVLVDSSVWACELAVLAEEYRTAVNGRLGKEAVTSMRFDVSKRVSLERERDEETEAGGSHRDDRVAPVPASETEVEQIRHMAAAIKTESVREAVVAAARRNLEWRKGLEAANAAQRAAQSAAGGKTDPERNDS